jgi:hypothetical protein
MTPHNIPCSVAFSSLICSPLDVGFFECPLPVSRLII